MRLCEYCRQPNLRSVNARYCSRDCKQRAYSARKLEARHAGLADRTCDQCGQPISPDVTPRARFCSRDCALKYHTGQRVAAKQAVSAAVRTGRGPCEQCGNPVPLALRAGTKYCGAECRAKAWRERAGYMRRYLYGITPDQWAAQMAAQDGRCAICRTDEWTGKDNRPHADHDHETGRFRGILCDACNQGLGRFRDDPARLRAAAAYLEAALAS